jgi:YegS/Rv2252/BmrU family lipid kinase
MTGADMEGKRKHLFIINPVSFRTEREMNLFVDEMEDHFRGLIKEECALQVSLFSRHAIRTVRRYITQAGAEQAVRVYAVGGDGILFDCLNGIVGLPNAELVPVPYGRTNDFVRAFGEGKNDLFKDIPLLASAALIPTDILHCGSNYALNFCLVGLESAAAFRAVEMQRQMKNFPRFIRNSSRLYNILYYLGGFLAMFDQKIMRQEYTISIDGEDLSGSYVSVNIANGPCYGGDKSAVVTAVPDDGLMDVLLCKSRNTLRGLSQILPYTRGHYDRFPGDFILRRGKTVTIRSRDPMLIYLDGETFLDTNIRVELIQRAVKIAAPGNIGYQRRRPFHE